jgi:hypothetical protein
MSMSKKHDDNVGYPHDVYPARRAPMPRPAGEARDELTGLAWETGLAEDGTWLRRLVGDWEPDPARAGENAFGARAATRVEGTDA